MSGGFAERTEAPRWVVQVRRGMSQTIAAALGIALCLFAPAAEARRDCDQNGVCSSFIPHERLPQIPSTTNACFVLGGDSAVNFPLLWIRCGAT